MKNSLGHSLHSPAFSRLGWNTATSAGPVGTSPHDLSTLGEHLGTCQPIHPHLFALHCVADAMHGFVAARFVTTLVVIALLLGLSSWIF